jgi:GH43 family beta-xylosidase
MKVVVALLFLISVLSGGLCESTTDLQEKADPCVLSNPVADGQDPWVIKKEGYYYYIETRNEGLYISKSKNLSDIKTDEKLVWELPESGWNQSNLWAPELHFVQGKWYIYYTAGKSGPPFIHQRSGVLESKTDDPMGEYIDKGQLYTGNNIQTKEDNIWSIDLTVLEHNGKLYGIWSGWEENRETDRTPQHLYIAEMDTPWSIVQPQVELTRPEYEWEKQLFEVNEGAAVIKKNDKIFMTYSASGTDHNYSVGLLTADVDADLLDSKSWEKSPTPVFESSEENGIYGPGHNSFTTTPDGSTDLFVYHARSYKEIDGDPLDDPNRHTRVQVLHWNEDGTPDFGVPLPDTRSNFDK